jgi:ketol-acid reductoisomerase
MVAPKGPGTLLRDRYERGLGLPCLLAVHRGAPGVDAEAIALAWAAGIGGARAGIIATSFAEETETDLFGEQAVLCGGLTALILAAFETLVDAGYPPELAYLECGHEVKQIADLIYERGLAAMMQAISNTAEFGAYEAGERVVDEHVRRNMRRILDDVRSGEFAARMQEDHARDFRWFSARRARLAQHPIDAAGAVIRGLMDAATGTDPTAPAERRP